MLIILIWWFSWDVLFVFLIDKMPRILGRFVPTGRAYGPLHMIMMCITYILLTYLAILDSGLFKPTRGQNSVQNLSHFVRLDKKEIGSFHWKYVKFHCGILICTFLTNAPAYSSIDSTFSSVEIQIAAWNCIWSKKFPGERSVRPTPLHWKFRGSGCWEMGHVGARA